MNELDDKISSLEDIQKNLKINAETCESSKRFEEKFSTFGDRDGAFEGKYRKRVYSAKMNETRT